jgi:hypothetical protein
LVKYLLLFLCAAISLAWFVNKRALYEGLEYTIDIFLNLQAARSVFIGDGFLNDYFQGGQKGIHNFFVFLLLGPLTVVWGAKAFFAVTGLLEAGASMRWVASAEPGTLAKVSSIVLAMLFGPLMFWIVDDPFYGWHAELLYPFLSVLLAEAMLNQRKTVWLWAGLIVLCREEGALLAGGIAVIGLASRRAPARQMVRTYSLSLSIFALSMLLVRLWHRPGTEDRVKTALEALLRFPYDHALLTDFSLSALSAVAMFAAGLIPLFALGGKRLAPWAILLSLPLWGVTAIGTLAYARQPGGLQLHGFLWPLRFSLMWSILLAACVFALPDAKASRTPVVVGCALFSILLQMQVLGFFRGYHVSERIAAFSPTAADTLSPRSLAWMNCLGQSLPRQTVIQPHWNLEAPFEKQIIVGDIRLAPHTPDIFVCDKQSRLPLPGEACLRQLSASLTAGYIEREVDGIAVAANPALRAAIDACPASMGRNSRF